MTAQDIFIAEFVSDDGLTVRVGVAACPEDPEDHASSVAETAESVTVEMRVETKQGDCGFEADVELSAPIGTRRLIDAYDLETIPLAPDF